MNQNISFKTAEEGCLGLAAFMSRSRVEPRFRDKPRSRNKSGMTGRRLYPHSRRPGRCGALIPIRRPGKCEALIRDLRTEEGCLEIAACSSRSRNKPRSRNKSGMTGRWLYPHSCRSGKCGALIPIRRPGKCEALIRDLTA